MLQVLGLIFFFVLFMILPIVIQGRYFRWRVREFLASRGATLTDATWLPYAPGYTPSRGAIIYEIRYTNSRGESRKAYVRTALIGKVELLYDHVVEGDALDK